MIRFFRYLHRLILFLVLFSVLPSAAIEIGIAVEQSQNAGSLLVNGRNVSVNTSGIGLKVSDYVLSDHIYLSAGALFASNGSSSATFSGASVSGPARLNTTFGVIKAYAFPNDRWTPLAYYSISNSNGDIDFNGYRNATQALGTANMSYGQEAWGAGLRFNVIPDWSLELITGMHHWKLLSDAKGTLGSLSVTTNIEASHTDTFNTVSIKYKFGKWMYSGEYGSYVLRSDNKINTNSLKFSADYRF